MIFHQDLAETMPLRLIFLKLYEFIFQTSIIILLMLYCVFIFIHSIRYKFSVMYLTWTNEWMKKGNRKWNALDFYNKKGIMRHLKWIPVYKRSINSFLVNHRLSVQIAPRKWKQYTHTRLHQSLWSFKSYRFKALKFTLIRNNTPYKTQMQFF